MPVANVVDALLTDPFVTGITISGGEPMLQAPALLDLVRCARRLRDLNIICFTGFTLKKLTSPPRSSAITSLLEELDVLIDGPYIQSLDDNRGLRGSSNQRVHQLSGFLQGWDFENLPRRVELQFGAEYALLVGVPPQGLVQTFDLAVTTAVGGYSNVRP
jgi:anaerobic ribonucleoside-triphosphate reductase activating protein